MKIPKAKSINDLPLFPLAEALLPTCYKCANYIVNDKCKAFPNGIPKELLTSPRWHIMLLPEQVGDYIFEVRKI